MENKKILFENKNFKEIANFLNKNKERRIFNFLNQHDLYQLVKNQKFKKSLQKNYCANFIDGITISRFLSLKSLSIVYRIRGPFFTKKFMSTKESDKFKHFFIGFEEKDIKLLKKKYPLLKKVNYYNPPYIKKIEFQKEEIENMAKKINKSKANIVWVGIGCPKQNLLSNSLFTKTKAQYFMNVGAALDFLLEKKKEAPNFFKSIGLEWFYRLITDFKYSNKKVLRSLIALKYLNQVKIKN